MPGELPCVGGTIERLVHTGDLLLRNTDSHVRNGQDRTFQLHLDRRFSRIFTGIIQDVADSDLQQMRIRLDSESEMVGCKTNAVTHERHLEVGQQNRLTCILQDLLIPMREEKQVLHQ